MSISDVLSKVKKLLSLATSDNEHEAAAAAAAAAALMQEHRIRQSMLEEAEEEPMRAHETLVGGKRVASWKTRLAVVIAKTNGVLLLKSGTILTMTGRESDVNAVRYLYAYCSKAIDDLTLREGAGNGRKWCSDYRHGCTDTIVRKLKEQRKEEDEMFRAKEQAAGTSLLRISNALAETENRIQAALQASGVGRTRAYYPSAGRSSFARECGRHDGEAINLGRGKGLSQGAAGFIPSGN